MMPAKIDYEKCTGCGSCYRECPADCYALGDDGKIVLKYPEECWHCGICEYECPAGALDVQLPPQALLDINKRLLAPLGKPKGHGPLDKL